MLLLFSTIVLGRYFAWNPASIKILPGDKVTVSIITMIHRHIRFSLDTM